MITVRLPLYMRIIYEYVRIENKLELCIIANYFFLYALLVYLNLRQLKTMLYLVDILLTGQIDWYELERLRVLMQHQTMMQ